MQNLKVIKSISETIPANFDELRKRIVKCHTKEQFFSSFSAEIIRDQKFKSLIKITLDNFCYYIKVWWNNNFLRLLKDKLKGGDRAEREGRGYLILEKYGIETPKLIEYGVIKLNQWKGHSYIITEEIRGVETLNERLLTIYDPMMIKFLAENIYRLHSNDIIYGDFHHENVLISNASNKKFFFLDSMAVKRDSKIRNKIYDIANFIFYAQRTKWENKKLIIDELLDAYLACWPDRLLDSYDFRKMVKKEVRKKKVILHFHRLMKNLG
jgi:tRNA A-37 threonylcarbamoyl transferase component Bud32